MNLKILIKLFSIIVLLLSLTYCGQQENDPQNPGTDKPETYWFQCDVCVIITPFRGLFVLNPACH